MTDTIDSLPDSASAPSPLISENPASGLDKISALLGDLNNSPAAPTVSMENTQENQFLAVRLGVAASLFYCLRGKHRQTADHSLRVALGCSAWTERLGLPADVRDRLEVAALLHDIGKIATPDRVLKKPSHLSGEEKLTMDRAPEMGCEILRGCCNDEALFNIVRYSRNWYESRRDSNNLSGEDIPLGARMLAIVDSFDSMTTDQVYRRALSRERAVAELFQCAGTQFDPQLVRDFASLLENRPEVMYGSIARRWLRELNEESSNGFWSAGNGIGSSSSMTSTINEGEMYFHQHLLDTMCDGVVAIDREGMITHWNFAFERMTNIAAGAVIGQSWSEKIIRWHESRENHGNVPCNLINCLVTATQTRRRMRMICPDGTETPVKVNFIPVLDNQNAVQGALAIVQDISEEESLERKVRTLHVKATRDGLTGVANRTEFDRTLAELVELAADGQGPASIILCDIDKFKLINDNHGHQAGDEALVSFASILSRHSRDGDLVARYGGEEFALLCPGCDNATAARRAETIRQELEKTPQDALGGKCITASFGVTEFQPGDTEDTMVARSDRALYKAKENGRNRVIQLGSGTLDYTEQSDKQASSNGWLSWLTTPSKSTNIEAQLKTPVPVEMVIEKLRGFIADHDAEILRIEGQSIELRVDTRAGSAGRRSADSITAFQISLNLKEQVSPPPAHFEESSGIMETIIDATIVPWKSRDRRNREMASSCKNVISSLRSYLMAEYVSK